MTFSLRTSSRVQELARLSDALHVSAEPGAVIDRLGVDQCDQQLAHELHLLSLREQDFVGHLSRLEPATNARVLRLQRRELLILVLEVRRLLLRDSSAPPSVPSVIAASCCMC